MEQVGKNFQPFYFIWQRKDSINSQIANVTFIQYQHDEGIVTHIDSIIEFI